VVLNAVNEVAVEAFLARRIAFPAIPELIDRSLDAAAARPDRAGTLAEIRAVDAWARSYSGETIGTLTSS
jgi:1-deoxy-D-xylulose-5-phosphate reductoisomerase